MSRCKPHRDDAGYVTERIYRPTGARIVVYEAAAQGVDVDGRYAVVCSMHHTMVGTTSVPRARAIMLAADFCEECQDATQKLRA